LVLGASVDLTLLANLRITDPQRFFLTCVSGEAGAGRSSDPPLLLEKDDRIVRTFPPGQPLYLARNGSHQVTLRGFSKPSDLVGVFSCVGGAGARRTRVLYVHNSPGGESGLPGDRPPEGGLCCRSLNLPLIHSTPVSRQGHTHGEQR
jgi:tyrosine kinase receptor 1